MSLNHTPTGNFPTKKAAPRPLLAVLLLVLFFNLVGCAEDISLGYTLQAKHLVEEKNNSQAAIEAALQATLTDPSYPPGWYWLGVSYYNDNQYQNAINAFEKVLALGSSSQQNISSRDYLQRAKNKLAQGQQSPRASQPDPKVTTPPLYTSGMAAYRAGDYNRAIHDFNQLLQQNPDYSLATFGRGLTYVEMGDLERGLADFANYLQHRPGSARALIQIGRCHYLQGNFSMAIQQLNRAIQHMAEQTEGGKTTVPENVTDFFGGGTADIQTERDPEDMRSALRYKGFAYLGLGDAATALTMLHRAHATKEYDLNGDLALYYYVLGDMNKVWHHRGGRAMIGLLIKEVNEAETIRLEVVGLIDHGPAAQAGIVSGDQIVKLENAPIQGLASFLQKVKELAVGQRVELTLLREGVERKVTLTPASAEPLLAGNKLIAPLLAGKQKKSPPANNLATSVAPQQPGSPLPPTTGRYWAVVIGISDYSDSRIPRLRYGARDARAFYQWLTSASGGRLPPANMQLLLNGDATAANIKKALFVWLSQALKEDVIIIYFAGHGSPNSPDSSKNLFLLPHDTRYDDIATSAFPMWDIETALQRFIQSERVIVIADACHSGGIGQPFQIARRANRNIATNKISAGFSNLAQVGGGICVISASDESQLSQESRDWGGGHGVFTYFLLKGLQGEADYNANGTVSLGEIIPFLSENVRRATGNAQSPTVSGKFDPALTIGR